MENELICILGNEPIENWISLACLSAMALPFYYSSLRKLNRKLGNESYNHDYQKTLDIRTQTGGGR